MPKNFAETEGDFSLSQCRLLPVWNMAAKARGDLGHVLCFITLIPGLANQAVIRNNPTAERAADSWRVPTAAHCFQQQVQKLIILSNKINPESFLL